jgi:hypothetical protein
MRKIFILTSVVAIACILSGCSGLSSPAFEVTSRSSRTGLEGANEVGYGDLTIRNSGGDGAKTIQVRVNQSSNFWTKEQSLYLKNGESQTIEFSFPEIELFTSSPSWYYVVNII